VTDARFDATLNRVRERLRLRRLSANADADQTRYLTHLVSRVGTRDIVILLETIDYIKADDVYAAVVVSGKRYLVRTALETLARCLDPTGFSRIHRSYIVRLDRVREVRRAKGAEVVMGDGTVLPVSRRRRRVIEAFLKPSAPYSKGAP
jgi:two-component system LytT family response regulator